MSTILKELFLPRALLLMVLMCLLVGASTNSLTGQVDSDSLFRRSYQYLQDARAVKGDFQKKGELAQQAAAGFEALEADSLWIEARFMVAQVAYYSGDSMAFVREMEPTMDKVLAGRDTNLIVKAYNTWGSFYFSQGNVKKGTEMLQVPDRMNYYSANSLDQNVSNLGALVDIGLGYTMNMDTVSYYVNRLQQLASVYPDPSVQVVSRFKLAQLFTKALNYEESLDILRAAYPYLSGLDNKGFSYYYYKSLVNNFINLGIPDSASHYIEILQEVASYPPGDPRSCYTIVSRVRTDLDLGDLNVLPAEFDVCYDLLTDKQLDRKKADINTLSTIYTKARFLLLKKNWDALEEVLSLLIEGAHLAKSNQFLVYAYELKYKAFIEQGLTEQALEAHLKYKSHSDKINNYIFTQSETLIRNQYNLQLVEEENKVLQVENQNQKLRITRDRGMIVLFVLGILLLGLLVTYFVRLSSLRARQSEELSRLVKKRTTQLEEANRELLITNKELLDSNVELERFAYIASHDLKTPLHNIIKFAGLLNSKLETPTNREIKEYLSFIIQGGKRMNYLIEDVLEYSKLSKHQNTNQKRNIDLSVLVNDIRKSISEYLDQRNATIELTSPLPELCWNHAKMFILFKNLIENGVKYNQSPQPTIKIYCVEEQQGKILYFEDNGIGIEEEFHEKIFQMFTRLHNHSTYEGSGLGLAACRKIVEEFEGEISCQSGVETGTIFKVALPSHLSMTSEIDPSPELKMD